MTTASRIPGVRRVRFQLRARASLHPALYLPFARMKYPGPSPEVLGRDTELVIDGYTRSASTFAVYALQLAQRRPVRLAHHLHASAQLIEAARRGVPALLLVREPEGAVLSQLAREPGVAMRDALAGYVRYHESLRSYLDRLVVGEFESVTNDFGSVLRRLNERFGLCLEPFVATPENTRECFAFVEQRGCLSPVLLGFESGLVTRDDARDELRRLRRTSAPDLQREAWVPSAARRHAKEALGGQWRSTALAGLRDRAQDIYAEFAAAQPSAVGGSASSNAPAREER